MAERRPSITASIVAFGRSLAGVDPVASRLVPFGLAQLARGFERGGAWLFPLADHMRVRTLAIDEQITEAARRGTKQLVVLGAGLCARAWRMPELGESIVYEVDRPSTQRYKRTRLEGLQPKAREVRFVSVDFEKDDLTKRLEEAGHDASARTTWIWEGVTPYLTPAAIAGTLAAIRARSANGSTLLITYGTPAKDRSEADRLLIRGRIVLYGLALPVLRAIGEPMHGLMSVKTMHRLLMANGFEVKEDSSFTELARRMALRRPHVLVGERLAVAVAVSLPGA